MCKKKRLCQKHSRKRDRQCGHERQYMDKDFNLDFIDCEEECEDPTLIHDCEEECINDYSFVKKDREEKDKKARRDKKDKKHENKKDKDKKDKDKKDHSKREYDHEQIVFTPPHFHKGKRCIPHRCSCAKRKDISN